jgi:hypothetical protein
MHFFTVTEGTTNTFGTVAGPDTCHPFEIWHPCRGTPMISELYMLDVALKYCHDRQPGGSDAEGRSPVTVPSTQGASFSDRLQPLISVKQTSEAYSACCAATGCLARHQGSSAQQVQQ